MSIFLSQLSPQSISDCLSYESNSPLSFSYLTHSVEYIIVSTSRRSSYSLHNFLLFIQMLSHWHVILQQVVISLLSLGQSFGDLCN